MQQKFVQIGNSKGIIIAQDLMKQLGFDAGSPVFIHPDAQTGTIIISKEARAPHQAPVPAHLLSILEKVNKEYGPALKKLANL